MQIRVADRTLHAILKDTPARSHICHLCNTYGRLHRQVDGPVGPAAVWLCYQCLLDKEVTHFVEFPGQARNGQSSGRAFMQELLRSYRPLRFIEDDGSAYRACRMYHFCYELLSLLDEDTSPNITISISDSATGPRGYRKRRRGYLNCGLDMSSDQHSPLFLRFVTQVRAGSKVHPCSRVREAAATR
jgi:hypothetical protein